MTGPLDLDAIEARARNTTNMIYAGRLNRDTGRHEYPNGIHLVDDEGGADVTFYLAARHDVPALVAEVRRLLEALDRAGRREGELLDMLETVGRKP